MTIVRKYNYITKNYALYTTEYNVRFATEQDQIVHCVKCYKKFNGYKDGYDSDQYRNDVGICGFAICDECHQEEIALRQAVGSL